MTNPKVWRYLLELRNAPRLPNATITKPTIFSRYLHATKVHLLHNERCRSGEREGNTAQQTTANVTQTLACRPDTLIPIDTPEEINKIQIQLG